SPAPRVAEHSEDRGRAGLPRDEHLFPVLLGGTDHHGLEPAEPELLASDAPEHRTALARVRAVCLFAGRVAPVLVTRLCPETHQVQHVNGPGSLDRAEVRELFLRGIDMLGCHGATIPRAS